MKDTVQVVRGTQAQDRNSVAHHKMSAVPVLGSAGNPGNILYLVLNLATEAYASNLRKVAFCFLQVVTTL